MSLLAKQLLNEDLQSIATFRCVAWISCLPFMRQLYSSFSLLSGDFFPAAQ